MQDDLCYLAATRAVAMFRSRELSPVELVTALIERAERVNPLLNAFTSTFPERALAAARQAEAAHGQASGAPRPLEGVPLAIKDLHAIEGEITTHGSKVYAESRDTGTSPHVQRLLEAGAILWARTTSPEFGAAPVTWSRLWGVTRNPWNPAYSPGGSSGGAAAAVAAGMTTLADGSDYGGSIRIPASACGVFGYKPPWGRVPSEAPWNLDPYNHYGPITRTVADGALMQNVMSGVHPRDIASLREQVVIPPPDELEGIRGWRIACSLDLGFFEVDHEVARNTRAALDVFRELGCRVDEVELGWTSAVAAAIMARGGFLLHYRPLLARWRYELSDYIVEGIEAASRVTLEDRASVLEVQGEMYDRLGPILEEYDAFICPTLAAPSVSAAHSLTDPTFTINGKPVDARRGWVMTYPFNMLSQLPVASVPSGFASTGVPTGIQIVGRSFDDLSVFRAAAAYERARPWLDTP
jgi:amidase